jgi:hypothetical protein
MVATRSRRPRWHQGNGGKPSEEQASAPPPPWARVNRNQLQHGIGTVDRLYLTHAECKLAVSDELRFHCGCVGLPRWLKAREAAFLPSIEGDFFNTKGNH